MGRRSCCVGHPSVQVAAVDSHAGCMSYRIEPGSILLAVDGSEHAERATHRAADQAFLEGRPLVVMSAASTGRILDVADRSPALPGLAKCCDFLARGAASPGSDTRIAGRSTRQSDRHSRLHEPSLPEQHGHDDGVRSGHGPSSNWTRLLGEVRLLGGPMSGVDTCPRSLDERVFILGAGASGWPWGGRSGEGRVSACLP